MRSGPCAEGGDLVWQRGEAPNAPSQPSFDWDEGAPRSNSPAPRRSRTAARSAEKRQTATSEVLRIISSSPSEIQPVLDTVAENAARLCGADNAVIFRLENNVLRLVASYGGIPTTSHAREGIPANRDT